MLHARLLGRHVNADRFDTRQRLQQSPNQRYLCRAADSVDPEDRRHMEHHLARPVIIQTRARQAPDAVAKLAALALVVAAGVVVRTGAASQSCEAPGWIVKLMHVALRQELLPQGAASVFARVLVEHSQFMFFFFFANKYTIIVAPVS